MSDDPSRSVEPLRPAELLLFDFIEADDQYDERVAYERARSLAHSAPFLGAAHLVCGAALLAPFLRLGLWWEAWLLALPLAGLLVLDWRLWILSARRKQRDIRPHKAIRLTFLYAAVGALLWLIIAHGAARSGLAGSEPSIRAALVAGMGATIAAFMSIPALVLISSLAPVAAAIMFMRWEVASMVTLFSGALAWLSLHRARDALLGAQRRLVADWNAHRASRFVDAFEASGTGWFWETNADGALTYVSQPLARQLGREADELCGRAFAELLLVEESAGDADRPTLGFHLSARFPFADVIVTPNGRQDACWSLSGSPNFDDLGRFLGFRGIGQNLSDERRSQAMTSRLARVDPLTGLPNRAAMREMLEKALANSASRKQGCALLLIDLDRFKAVNDTLGHPIGDVLLKHVAQRLAAVIGDHGQIGRLGGDEFEAVLPGIDDEGQVAALADRLIQQVTKPYVIRGHSVTIGASVGIAIARPGKAYGEALVRDADLALYAAKDAGRGTFRFYDPEMHSEAADRQILQKDLDGAVEKGQLRLLFQPVIAAASEDLVGFEALVRWAHPTRGQLSPADFLPLAEEGGVILGIGDWILRTACAEAAKWPAHLRLSVNLSLSQLSDSSIAARVTNALAAASLAPERLELEVREEALLADGPEAHERLAQLHGLGVRLALDDFGTGYSSVASLKAAPLSRIKLDRGFLRGGLPERSRTRALLRSIVAMSGSLGMDVTAEGAETLEDLALAREIGCSHIQGFIFGRPMAAAEALDLASTSRALSAREVGETRAPRHSLIRRGTLSWDSKAFQVRLRNISSGGAMVESDRALCEGAEVQLDLAEGVLIGGRVCWSQDGRVGLQFHDNFDLRQLGRSGTPSGLKVMKPAYLSDETSPSSPWAGRQERLTIKDVRRR